ncbi:VOC family protein [Streptosporangium sp. DT93]|uniref:VOC family protein n=1 Tax=Streptosporangium sp. DT93 TaxID=3393428 RepID=UPI003CEF6812
MTTKAQFLAVNIDCAEPRRLAGFYATVFGYEVQYAEDTYAGIGDGTTTIYFQQNLDRKPSVWPGPDKQFHLDVRVPDVKQAVEDYLELGATKPDFQPDEDKWVVMADPEGHLFCVCPSAG